ncbi:MAG: hypothetical protein ACKVQU_32845 [Burkholderiales bacterium]
MNAPSLRGLALLFAFALGIALPKAHSAAQADRYTSIHVLSPASEATLFDNDGTVPVEIALSPALNVAANHRIRVGLDRTVLSPDRTQLRFRLENVDRGEHWLRIEIVDAGGNTLITAAPVKFHVWRASVRLPDQKSRRHPL